MCAFVPHKCNRIVQQYTVFRVHQRNKITRTQLVKRFQRTVKDEVSVFEEDSASVRRVKIPKVVHKLGPIIRLEKTPIHAFKSNVRIITVANAELTVLPHGRREFGFCRRLFGFEFTGHGCNGGAAPRSGGNHGGGIL